MFLWLLRYNLVDNHVILISCCGYKTFIFSLAFPLNSSTWKKLFFWYFYLFYHILNLLPVCSTLVPLLQNVLPRQLVIRQVMKSVQKEDVNVQLVTFNPAPSASNIWVTAKTVVIPLKLNANLHSLVRIINVIVLLPMKLIRVTTPNVFGRIGKTSVKLAHPTPNVEAEVSSHLRIKTIIFKHFVINTLI